MPSGISRRIWLAWAFGAVAGCARSLGRAPAAPLANEEQDAAERARAIIDAKVGALFYVGRIRGRPGVAKLTSFAHWQRIADKLGIDAIGDVDRAFACAAYSAADDSALLLEHSLEEPVVLEALMRASGGALAPMVPTSFPSTTVDLRDRQVAVGIPRPGMIASVPGWAAQRFEELAGAGGLPNPRGIEAARFFALHPGQTLETPPEWPPSIGASQAEIAFDDEGGANVLFQATSASPEQARLDAQTMEKTLDDLLHIDLEIIRIPIFDPIHFSADGNVVRMEAHLLASDVDWILSFGS
jgi:hypothetical protein